MTMADDMDVSSHVDEAQHLCCSFPVTGPYEAYQAVYVCNTCAQEDELLCVCEACAMNCHREHEGLVYVGMGPAYCDCHKMDGQKCEIFTRSSKRASDFGVLWQGPSGINTCKAVSQTEETDNYQIDPFQVSGLNDEAICARLMKQAEELISTSRETFWLDLDMDQTQYCDLEKLARAVFDRHAETYDLRKHSRILGAEWWVQMKSVSLPISEDVLLHRYVNGKEAVDLHYDKDEELAEFFGLGVFPRLSTVTYLTESRTAAPTVVFSRKYDEGDSPSIPISSMTVSQPRRGKHLVFDGRLLHGAPSHYALRPSSVSLDGATTASDRLTFLVNIWVDHRPAGVNVLPGKVRDSIKSVSEQAFAASTYRPAFEPLLVSNVDLNDENELPESIRGRVELPFVGKGATWEIDADGGLMLITYPPPIKDFDTLRVRFGSGLQAYLDYVEGQDIDACSCKERVGMRRLYDQMSFQ